MSHQFIAGPCMNLLKGTSEVLPYYQNYFHVINNNDTNNIVVVIDVSILGNLALILEFSFYATI